MLSSANVRFVICCDSKIDAAKIRKLLTRCNVYHKTLIKKINDLNFVENERA
jgi:hypothetical protein